MTLRRSRRALACLALAAMPALASAQAEAPHAVQVRLARSLADALAVDCTDDALCAAERLARIGKLGPPVVPVLLMGLERDVLELDGATLELDAEDPDVLWAALGRFPESLLRSALRRRHEEQPNMASCALGLSVIERFGSADGVGLALDLASWPGGERGARPTVGMLQAAVEAVLARDPRGFAVVVDEVPDAHADLREALVRAMGASGSPRAIEPLLGLLGRQRELDLPVLTQLARLTSSDDRTLEPRRIDPVRELLRADARVAREAMIVVGRLRDFESVPVLIEYLASGDARLRQQALWSLQRISGLGLRADPGRWRAWERSESRWWESARTLLARLDGTDTADVLAAINEVAARRLFRDGLSRELQPLLRRGETVIVRNACSALGQLGSPSSVGPLIDALCHPDAEVRDEARRALGTITGLDLPPDPARWEEALPDA
jgi:HEAT repeat protein